MSRTYVIENNCDESYVVGVTDSLDYAKQAVDLLNQREGNKANYTVYEKDDMHDFVKHRLSKYTVIIYNDDRTFVREENEDNTFCCARIGYYETLPFTIFQDGEYYMISLYAESKGDAYDKGHWLLEDYLKVNEK